MLCAREVGPTPIPVVPILATGLVALAVFGGALYLHREQSKASTAPTATTAVVPGPAPVAYEPAWPAPPPPTANDPAALAPTVANAAAGAVSAAPAAATAAKSTEPDPVALRAAARSVNVVMYTTTWCPQCRRAKAWLDQNDVRFAEHDIEASASSNAACKKLNPVCSIPTIDVDGEVIIGYSPGHMRAAIDAAARRRLAK